MHSKYVIELIHSSEETITLSSVEWSIIVMINKYPDFNRLISELKKSYKMTVEEIKMALGNLQKKKILKLYQAQVTEETSILSAGASQPPQIDPETPNIFWEKLENELSRAIGPIASIVIEDSISDFNIQREKFPVKFLYSLVEKVAAELNSQSDKNQFQKAMLEVIKQI